MNWPTFNVFPIVGGMHLGVAPHKLPLPLSPAERNLRINSGRFSRRPGTRVFGADAWRNDADSADNPTAAGTITGQVIYYREDGASDVLSFTGGAAVSNRRIYRFDSGTPRWANITNANLYDAAGGNDLVNTATDMWDFAIAPNSTKVDVLYAAFGALGGTTSEIIRYHPGLASTADGVNLGVPGGPCRYLASFAGRLVLGYVFDTATGVVRGNRVAWSDYLNSESWTAGNAGAIDLTDTPDLITRLLINRNRLVIYKERSIWLCSETPLPNVPFGFEVISREIGTRAPFSVSAAQGHHFFLGSDSVYSFDGSSPPRPVGHPIHSALTDINPQAFNQVFSTVDENASEYVLFVPEGAATYPTAAWVYNWLEDTWTRWEFPFSITTATRAVRGTAELWSGTYAQNTDWDQTGVTTWADVSTSSGDTKILANSDKTAEEFTILVSGDGTSPIVSHWDSKDFDLSGEPGIGGRQLTTSHLKTLVRVAVRVGRGQSTSLTCSVSLDGGATFSSTLPSSATITSTGGVLYFDAWLTSDKFRIRLLNQTFGEPFPDIEEVILYYVPRAPKK